MNPQFSPEVTELYERLKAEAEAGGYHLNPDSEFTLFLVNSLLTNQQRYGYPVCPCRLALGEEDKDQDIICPCDYRDQDLAEYDVCFCDLYVSKARIEGKAVRRVVPDRRPAEYVLHGFLPATRRTGDGGSIRTTLPVWRCRVCGYLCAREQPPEVCPVCKARKERFERFEFRL